VRFFLWLEIGGAFLDFAGCDFRVRGFFTVPFLLMKNSHFVSSVLFAVLLAGCGGQESGVRHYKEVGSLPLKKEAAAPQGGAGMTAAAAPFMNAPAPQVPLAWSVPEGWTEKAGGGVRVVSFDAEGVECAILAFPPMMASASAEQKIGIWLQQLGAAVPSQEQLVSFVAKPKKLAGQGGISVEVYDFEDLLGASAPASMVAGLFKVGEQALSVRMKGSPKALAGQKDKFKALCESLRKKE
jgi:hypothetical protein